MGGFAEAGSGPSGEGERSISKGQLDKALSCSLSPSCRSANAQGLQANKRERTVSLPIRRVPEAEPPASRAPLTAWPWLSSEREGLLGRGSSAGSRKDLVIYPLPNDPGPGWGTLLGK